MREWPEFADVTCLAIACPSCMTLELARSCSSYVTTIINGADLIPTVSAGQSLWTTNLRFGIHQTVLKA